jgi:TRAP-type C4-dicarboxylate transport system permease small subunit
MRSLLIKITEYIIKITWNLSAILLAICAALIFIQVFSRFILDDPYAWTGMWARGSLLWMVFLMAPAGFRYSAMIELTFLRNIVPYTMRRWIITAVTILNLLFLSILAWYGFLLCMIINGQNISLINISMSWFYLSVPVGCLLSIPGVILDYFFPEERQIEVDV